MTSVCQTVSAGETAGGRPPCGRCRESEEENARLPRQMRQMEGQVLRQLEELEGGPPTADVGGVGGKKMSGGCLATSKEAWQLVF